MYKSYVYKYINRKIEKYINAGNRKPRFYMRY